MLLNGLTSEIPGNDRVVSCKGREGLDQMCSYPVFRLRFQHPDCPDIRNSSST